MDELETERLKLRAWIEDDIEPLARILADPQVMRFIGDGHPCSREEGVVWWEKIRRRWEEDGFDVWAAVLKQTDGLVGWIGLAVSDWLPELMSATEVGWLLDRRYWGRGLATEGGAASLAYAFGTLDVERVVSICHSANTASERVMQRLGMRREGDSIHPKFGTPLLIYALGRKEWISNRGVNNVSGNYS